MIYLDNAATTLPKPPEVLQAVNRALINAGSLGRGSHAASVYASEIAYRCRSAAASMFGAAPEQVIFTFNATHGLNIAIKTLVSKGDRVVISGFEHNAVLRPLVAVGADIVVVGRKLFDPDDTFASFRAAITKETKAVICTHVSNVFGYILPIEKIAKLCMKERIPLVIDASQSAGTIPLSLRDLGAAFIAMPGHKALFGPQGTGVLLCGDVEPLPILEGGTGSVSRSTEMPDFLPDRLEAGTQNTPGIAGLLAGIEYVAENHSFINKHEYELMTCLKKEIDRVKYDLYAADHRIQSGVLSVVPKEHSCESFAAKLADAGFAVRFGLHCAPLAHISAGTDKNGTIRISVSAFTKMDDIEKLISFMNSEK